MPILVPIQGVIVTRDGMRMIPPAGQPFDFSDAEARELLSNKPPLARELRDERRELGIEEPASAAAESTAQPTRCRRATVPVDDPDDL